MSYRKKHNTPKPERKEIVHDLEFGNPGVERSLYTGKLTSGLPYQRPVNQQEVERLLREWDDRLLEPLVVSFRDGKFYVVDGQHRIAAMRQMNGGQEAMVMCKIYSGLTYEQEAELCYKLDKAKKRLSLSQSTNALVESGTDAEVAEIRRLVEKAGFRWALGKRSGRPNEIMATRAVIQSYRLLGGAAFQRMLKLIKHTWRENAHATTAAMITGMALFLKTYETELNDSTFVKRMSAVHPEEIIRRGRLDFSTNRIALRYARVLLEKYNGGRVKLPYRFSS